MLDNLKLMSLLAGIFFGAWPLMMNRSGLTGNFSAVIMTGVSLACIAPFALSNIGNLSNVNWTMGIGAGVAAALGITLFNGMLAKASRQEVGGLFVVMIISQTVLAAIYSIAMNGGMTATKGLGFALAIVAGILLTI